MIFKGSGGGGGGSSFKQTPDNLRSEDTFEGVLGLATGPIEGLANGLKSLKIDGTPLENETGELNFPDFVALLADGNPLSHPQIVDLRLGAGAAPTQVGLSLTNDSDASGQGTPGPWVTKTLNNTGAAHIDLRFVVNQLYRQTDKGIYEETLSLEIEMKPTGSTNWINPLLNNSGGSTPTYSPLGTSYYNNIQYYEPEVYYNTGGSGYANTASHYTVKGKTSSASAYELRIGVPNTGNYANTAWDVRVRLLERDDYDNGQTEDQVVEKRTVSWESLAAVFDETMGDHEDWEGLAWLHVYGQASDQLTGIPEIVGRYKTKRVSVPPSALYDPVTRQYQSGIWDGTYVKAYTNDPAWCINDAIADANSGVSAFAPGSYMNKWDALEASRWFSELVPDGDGGTHPRYSMNIALQEVQQADEFIRYLAGACGAMVWDNGDGEWRMKVDKPETAVDMFTLDNIEGEFNYNHTDVDTRFNDITGQFKNSEFDFRQDSVRLFDNASIAQIGRKKTTIALVGCTNRQEAMRRIKLRLSTAVNETRMVNFTTNRRGRNVNPLDTILVADGDLGDQDQRTTGRVVAVSGDRQTITVRDDVRMEDNVAYTLKFAAFNSEYDLDTATDPTGTEWRKPTTVMEYGVTNTNAQRGNVKVIHLDTPLPADHPEYLSVALEATGLSTIPKLYRVVNVIPDEEDKERIGISAIEIDVDKWAASDGVTKEDGVFQDMRGVVPAPIAPSAGVIDLLAVPAVQGQSVNLRAGWERPAYPTLSGYRVRYRINGGAWVVGVQHTQNTDFELVNPPPGTYEFEIVAVGRSGGVSLPLTESLEVTQSLIEIEWAALLDSEGTAPEDNATDGATLGSNFRSPGNVTYTQAEIETIQGTAANITGQGVLATEDDIDLTFVTDAGDLAGLDQSELDWQQAQTWVQAIQQPTWTEVKGSKVTRLAASTPGWANRVIGAAMGDSGMMQFRLNSDASAYRHAIGFTSNPAASGFNNSYCVLTASGGTTASFRTYTGGTLTANTSSISVTSSDLWIVAWHNGQIEIYQNGILRHTITGVTETVLTPFVALFTEGSEVTQMRCAPYDEVALTAALNAVRVATMEDGADVTATSTAAAIAGQGSGATADTLAELDALAASRLEFARTSVAGAFPAVFSLENYAPTTGHTASLPVSLADVPITGYTLSTYGNYVDVAAPSNAIGLLADVQLVDGVIYEIAFNGEVLAEGGSGATSVWHYARLLGEDYSNQGNALGPGETNLNTGDPFQSTWRVGKNVDPTLVDYVVPSDVFTMRFLVLLNRLPTSAGGTSTNASMRFFGLRGALDVAAGSPITRLTEDGSTPITLPSVITDQGTAAAIAGQGDMATQNQTDLDLQRAQSWSHQTITTDPILITGNKVERTTSGAGWDSRVIGPKFGGSAYMQFRLDTIANRPLAGFTYSPDATTGLGFYDALFVNPLSATSLQLAHYVGGSLQSGAVTVAGSDADLWHLFWSDNEVRFYQNGALVHTFTGITHAEMAPFSTMLNPSCSVYDMRCGPYNPAIEQFVIDSARFESVATGADVTIGNVASAVVGQGDLALRDDIEDSHIASGHEHALLNNFHSGSGNGVNRVMSPEGGVFSSGNNASGAIKIALPLGWTNSMLLFEVNIYSYSQVAGRGTSQKYIVGGYPYSVTEQWINQSADYIGPEGQSRDVYFGHDGTDPCIWIGDETDNWFYPTVMVTNFHSRGSALSYGEGWSIGMDTVAPRNSAAGPLRSITKPRAGDAVLGEGVYDAPNGAVVTRNDYRTDIGVAASIAGQAPAATDDTIQSGAQPNGSIRGITPISDFSGSTEWWRHIYSKTPPTQAELDLIRDYADMEDVFVNDTGTNKVVRFPSANYDPSKTYKWKARVWASAASSNALRYYMVTFNSVAESSATYQGVIAFDTSVPVVAGWQTIEFEQTGSQPTANRVSPVIYTNRASDPSLVIAVHSMWIDDVTDVNAAFDAGGALGNNIYLENGFTLGTEALLLTSAGVAASIAGQALAATDSTIEGGADVSAYGSGPGTSSFAHSSGGVAESGEFSRDLSYKFNELSGQVTSGITWTYQITQGQVNGFSAGTTNRSMTGSGTGVLTINSLESNSATVRAKGVKGTKTVTIDTVLSKTFAPPNNNGGGGANVASQSSGFTDHTSTSFVAISNELEVTSGTTTLEATVNIQSNYDFNGSGTLKCKLQHWNGSSWVDMGAEETKTADMEYDFELDEYIDIPANFVFTRTKTVTASTSTKVRIVQRISAGDSGSPHNISTTGNFEIEA